MAINFPVSLDDFANVSTGDTITPAHKNDLNDAVEALMAKIGIDGSAVTTSFDYKFTHLPAQAGDWDAGAYEIRAAKFESDDTSAAPLSVASSAVCARLNADKVDGINMPGAVAQGDLLYAMGVSTLSALTKDTNATRYLANTGTNNAPAWNLVNLANGVTSALPTANGGTGSSTVQSAINALAGAVTNNKVLQGNGTNIILSAVGLASSVTGILPVGNGGTGASTAASAINAVLPTQTGNANKFLQTDASNPSWQAVDMATDVTGVLPVANGGTNAATAASARAALGLVIGTNVLAPNGDGSALTGITAVTQVNDTDSGTSFDTSETTFLSVAKTCTSGKTILLVASGYITYSALASNITATIKLKHGSTVAQTVYQVCPTAGKKQVWSACAIVTGLSGSVTFSVTAQADDRTNTAYGNLCVLEF